MRIIHFIIMNTQLYYHTCTCKDVIVLSMPMQDLHTVVKMKTSGKIGIHSTTITFTRSDNTYVHARLLRIVTWAV